MATRSDTGEVLHARLRKGSANTARGTKRFVEELIARVRRCGAAGEVVVRFDSGFWSNATIELLGRLDVRYTMAVRTNNSAAQARLWPEWRHHAFLTDLAGDTTVIDAFHRHHAVVELAIRDLKEGAGLEHLPSGHFSANSAWLQCVVLAHNLIRWTATLGQPAAVDQLTVARTVRTRLIAVPGRLVNRSGTPTLRGPQGWPWAQLFCRALERLRDLPLHPAPG